MAQSKPTLLPKQARVLMLNIAGTDYNQFKVRNVVYGLPTTP
jgi:hypothetical protein